MTFGSDRQDDDMSLLVTEHAATICGVILGRERVVAAAARQVRDDLFEGLLIGGGRDNGEVARWARHLGYDATREHRVLAVTFEAAGPGAACRGGHGAPEPGCRRDRPLLHEPGARRDHLGPR